MMESFLPAGVAAASIAVTYFVCIRPMRKGHCTVMPRHDGGQLDSQSREEIARLRAEIGELRQAQELDAPRGSATADRAGA